MALPIHLQVTRSGKKVTLCEATGKSINLTTKKNDVECTGFTGTTVPQTSTDTYPADVVLADNDKLALIVTAISGVPQNMTFSIFIENTVT